MWELCDTKANEPAVECRASQNKGIFKSKNNISFNLIVREKVRNYTIKLQLIILVN